MVRNLFLYTSFFFVSTAKNRGHWDHFVRRLYICISSQQSTFLVRLNINVWRTIVILYTALNSSSLIFALQISEMKWNLGASSFCPVGLVWFVAKLVTFTLTFELRDRNFIFGMHTQLMKPFQMTPGSITLWP